MQTADLVKDTNPSIPARRSKRHETQGVNRSRGFASPRGSSAVIEAGLLGS